MTQIKKAMILAAGKGVRMKPFTDHSPKALVPIHGRPIIDYTLDLLEKEGIEDCVVNLHHQAEKLRNYLSSRTQPKIFFSKEPELLDSGGGIKNALNFLGDESVFISNSDTILVGDKKSPYQQLLDHWDPKQMDFLLLAQPIDTALNYDPAGQDNLFIRADNTIGWKEEDNNQIKPYIYTGTQILSPILFKDIPEKMFSIKPLWEKALENGRLKTLVHQGKYFQNNTLEDIKRTEEKLLP